MATPCGPGPPAAWRPVSSHAPWPAPLFLQYPPGPGGAPHPQRGKATSGAGRLAPSRGGISPWSGSGGAVPSTEPVVSGNRAAEGARVRPPPGGPQWSAGRRRRSGDRGDSGRAPGPCPRAVRLARVRHEFRRGSSRRRALAGDRGVGGRGTGRGERPGRRASAAGRAIPAGPAAPGGMTSWWPAGCTGSPRWPARRLEVTDHVRTITAGRPGLVCRALACQTAGTAAGPDRWC